MTGFEQKPAGCEPGGCFLVVASYRSILISARGSLRDNLKWGEVISVSDLMLYYVFLLFTLFHSWKYGS